MAETPEATWLTQEAYDRLASELEYLLTDNHTGVKP